MRRQQTGDEHDFTLTDSPWHLDSGFDTALRGYQRRQVDNYVQEVQTAVTELVTRHAHAQQQIRDLTAQVVAVRAELLACEREHVADEQPTAQQLGSRLDRILVAAERQADELTRQAEHARAEARDEAEHVRGRPTRTAGRSGATRMRKPRGSSPTRVATPPGSTPTPQTAAKRSSAVHISGPLPCSPATTRCSRRSGPYWPPSISWLPTRPVPPPVPRHRIHADAGTTGRAPRNASRRTSSAVTSRVAAGAARRRSRRPGRRSDDRGRAPRGARPDRPVSPDRTGPPRCASRPPAASRRRGRAGPARPAARRTGRGCSGSRCPAAPGRPARDRAAGAAARRGTGTNCSKNGVNAIVVSSSTRSYRSARSKNVR